MSVSQHNGPSLVNEHLDLKDLGKAVAHGIGFGPVFVDIGDELADIGLVHTNLPDLVEQGQLGDLLHLHEILLEPAVKVVQFRGLQVGRSDK